MKWEGEKDFEDWSSHQVRITSKEGMKTKQDFGKRKNSGEVDRRKDLKDWNKKRQWSTIWS